MFSLDVLAIEFSRSNLTFVRYKAQIKTSIT